jgi:2-polyprenyl-6-methoxyphenol hydroxylase-like FAD-dependent oxidoreductase
MMRKVPVLIVGGGPVGLALAVELGWRGIACQLIDEGDGVIGTPKMNEVNIRSMEFCRRWGIADRVLDCPFPRDWPLDVAFVTSLCGHELGRLPRPPRGTATPDPWSPERLQVCSQIWFDPILQARARSFPCVTPRYGCRLEAFAHAQHGVAAEVVHLADGRRETIEADYLVGCDGAGSTVRRALGIELTGDGTIGHPVNLFFRKAGLLELCGKRPATFFIGLDRGRIWGNLRVIDPVNGLWRIMVDDTDGDVTPESVDREFHLRRALGRPLAVEWLDVNVWRRRSALAACYGTGRVFLAGDAVHQLSPTGGLGMNTGIGDAVDLGWKLAAVLQGWGGAKLLESYDRERRPVGARNVRMATGFHRGAEAFCQDHGDLDGDDAKSARLRREVGERLVRELGGEFKTVGLQIGYAYAASPICISDGTPAPPDMPDTYAPSARPGARAPHVWLRDGRSMLDLFGGGFVLLRFPGAPQAAAIEEAARSRGVPLTSSTVDEPEGAELYDRRLVLVRPDGHVAWRADALPADPAGLIDRVRGA